MSSETVFLLHSDGLPANPLFGTIDRGALLVPFSADDHWPDLRRLLRKYGDLPMSFADACLVQMAELAARCQVFTTDQHFRVYRRHGRDVIP